MTFIVAAISSIVMTIPFVVISRLQGGWQAMWPELLLAPYSFSFIVYMMLFGTLLILRDTSRYFFLSEGPQAVFISVIFLIAAPLVTKYGLPRATSPQVFAFYIGTLLIADLFLLQRLSSISKSLLDWPKRISVPNENAVISLFERKHPKPSHFPESHPQYQERLRLWKRAAREYYSKKVDTTIGQRRMYLFRGRKSGDIIKDRVMQWKWEKQLMEWYIPMQGTSEPTRFGKEWDSMVSQAVNKIKGKYQAEKLNRGDVFFSIEGPAILFGILYFLFIFMDRWATLFATGSTVLFGAVNANSPIEDQQFVTGIRLATLFILVGTGFLEIALLHIYASDMSGKNHRLKKGAPPQEIISKYERGSRAVYVKELSLFLAELLVVFTIITLIGARSMYGNPNTIIPYAIASFSYAGLLVALFHKLFIANEGALNTIMFFVFLVGVGGSTAAVILTGSKLWLLVISAGSTWIFALCAISLSWRDSVLRQREFRLSPNLNTSGFKRIGEPSSENSERERELLFWDLRQQRRLFHRIEPKSHFMWDIIGHVTSAPLNLSSLERAAFPRLVEHMVEAVDQFRAGRIIVYVVPAEVGTELGRTMLAVASMIRETGTLEIFTSIPAGCQDEGAFILEVLAHEYLECAKDYSHSDAITAAHILFKRGGLSGESNGSGNSRLASATSLDVTSRGRSEMNRLHCNTELIFSKNLQPLVLDLLRGGRGLSPISNILRGIEDLRNRSTPNQARSLLAAEVSLEIGSFTGEILSASRDTRVPPRPQQMLKDPYAFDEDPSSSVKILSSLRVSLLLVFLALIADARFGRELSSARKSFISRHILSLIFGASSWISIQLKKYLLYHRLSGVTTLESRLRGLQRVFYFSKGQWLFRGNVNGVHRIDFFDFRNRNAFSVRVQSTKSSLTCMSRYKGQKPLDWKPGPKDKPHSQAFFDKTNRLIWEQFSSGYTAIYEYSSKQAIYPEKRIMLAGTFDTDYLKCEDLEQVAAWKETQQFVPDSSLVTRAKIRVDRDGIPSEIFATYSYSSDRVLHYVEYQSFEEDWNLVAHLSRGWRPDTGATPRFSYADYRVGSTFFRVRFDYSHPQHVKLDCVQFDKFGGEETAPVPSFISIDPYRLLKRRPPVAYHLSNEFLTYKLDAKVHRELGRITKVEFYDEPYSTARSREELWAQWRLQQIPGAIARTLDLEVFLRNEPLLYRYFQRRDVGDFEGAIDQLQRNKEVLDVVVNVPDTPETRCSSMNVRMADLLELAAGGDSSLIASQVDNDNNVIKTVAVDSGTYPTGGGGVGSCRRDLVNFLERVRWTCLAELGTAEVPQREYQLEKHIDAIYYLIIWDLDFGNANENFRRTIPAPELELRRTRTSAAVIRSNFVPLIQSLVRAIFDPDLVESKTAGYESIFVNLYVFGQSHDWTRSWEHHAAIDAFVAAVLHVCSMRSEDSYLSVENPTLHEVGLAYSLITKLLLPLAAELPTFPNRRACFHLSHHGIQAISGVVAKALSGTTLILWDHGILWRERLFALCEADSMPRFVQTVLAGLNRLIAWLVIRRADTINPCTSIQNPMWEAHLGGGKFMDADSYSSTRLKISPVVNGMNVAKFKPNPGAELAIPTAVMLSHVSPVKDVANAIYAAAHIVNVVGWKNFQLHIYGSTEKDPAYTTFCTSLIMSNNLQSNVHLKGLGAPGVVLPSGWVFVNSSITEGLPLALGEAGLCGLPVVCTDVGGSREVISDLATGKCFGAIVPPSRPRQLAEAIIKVMAVTDGLGQLVPGVTDVRIADILAKGPSAAAELNARITSETTKQARRALGLLLRERTIQTFSIAKYWRVHEQMLYLGTAYVPPVEYVRRGTLVRKGTQHRRKFYNRLYEPAPQNTNRNSVGSL
ncbi:glycosyltransferase family 4 protein [Gonapodya prolifera JEL478]|uniref:Glycosyltransferase family 4 protein n=1 Tax=Gonapodya prolifera (strain JEL478) TaxID=1344416 RepID=A0A139AX29_GONPJ|nr:glycosyltransferase family 4 protein [Gonapodya prolifera JEL478]|eukprot:KXS21278.1 glycosyltransferase family 4 protein [Gonapodya prolifera JEL478]